MTSGAAETATPRVGVVAIGRNEGERLRACLESARRDVDAIIYVDSGSTDDSVAMARSIGAEVVDLDTSIPFTAARARNAGFERLTKVWPDVELVQFVDGDCELEAGWIHAARSALVDGDWTVLCGRRRERHPGASVYNLLCDMEWDTPVGETSACGGDSLIRVDALQAVGGYREDLIAGEEPELCVRLAEQGGRILRLDAAMTLHDADMWRASQWWTRAVRAGHAAAEARTLHPGADEGRSEKDVRSAWFWAAILPTAIVVTAFVFAPLSVLLAAAIPLQILRIGLRRPRPNFSLRDNLLYAAACVIGKAPHLQGMLRFDRGRRTGQRSTLIEYKGVAR